ncbi:MAG TPA: LysR family transcriptional regulator [Burkholderiales bacterium]|nr:LysR family transcriptional regulator [Betaproteobacteria bacterium]HQR52018.1 LysR family transcriptional regulator [Burkholderiales bacterium]
MELYQLRTFAAVAEFGHVTRAAEKVHISQPAVSAQIKALEEELGVPLFDRMPTGMVLTAPGRRLLALAERVLAAAQDLKAEARALAGTVAGRLRIGTVADPESIRLGEFLSRAVELHPLLELDIHHQVSGAAFESVRAGELDASFYFGRLSHPAVASLALQEIVYRVAAPAAWKDKVMGASWAELAKLPWILTPAISTHHGLVAELFAAQGVEPASVVQADHESVIANLIVSGLGLSLLRDDLARARERAGEVIVMKSARLTTMLQFIYLAGREQEPAIAALLFAVREVWGLDDTSQPKGSRKRRRDANGKPAD